MDRKELIAEWQELRESADSMSKRAIVEIERLEAKLAEQKPKLRHGGVYVDRSFVVVVRFCKGEWEATHADGSKMVGTHKRIREHLDDFTFSHNLFDDLKAMSEDVTKDYKVKCRCNDADVMRISIDCACPDNDMMFAVAERSVHIDPEDIPGLILYLRRGQATLQRRQNSE